MMKHILEDYERDVFSGEVCLRPGEEHPNVRGTERLGFAKLDLYPNAKPRSVKPIHLLGEHAAAEQEKVEDFLARGWIEPCPASVGVQRFCCAQEGEGKMAPRCGLSPT